MYYSFKCTYCGREFYTYDSNREGASKTLYRTVKQHLIDYNEDHKEYQMDDGEDVDSDQIYAEMSESDHKPPGAYEANVQTVTPVSSGGTHHYSNALLIFFILLILGFVCLLIIFPGFQSFIKQLFPSL